MKTSKIGNCSLDVFRKTLPSHAPQWRSVPTVYFGCECEETIQSMDNYQRSKFEAVAFLGSITLPSSGTVLKKLSFPRCIKRRIC